MYWQMTFDEYLKQKASKEASNSKNCQMQHRSEQSSQSSKRQIPTSASSKH